MTSSSIRKHAGVGPASDQPTVPEPAFAERARTLMYLGRIGSLSTLSRKQPGFPFGSVMPYGLDDHGRPIFLISTMAMHTQNLQADPRASLLVTQDDTGGDPLGAARVTLVGNVLPIPESEVPEARKLYLQRYANSKYWVDFEDFSFYRMDVVDVYSVGASCLASISVNVPRQVLLFGASMVGEVPMYSQGAFSLEQGDPSTSQSRMGTLHRPLRYCTPASTICKLGQRHFRIDFLRGVQNRVQVLKRSANVRNP